MKKALVIKGRWNTPLSFAWKGDLITSLKAASEWADENDCPGYFFEVANANPEFVKEMKLPIFVNKYGDYVAPTDYEIREVK